MDDGEKRTCFESVSGNVCVRSRRRRHFRTNLDHRRTCEIRTDRMDCSGRALPGFAPSQRNLNAVPRTQNGYNGVRVTTGNTSDTVFLRPPFWPDIVHGITVRARITTEPARPAHRRCGLKSRTAYGHSVSVAEMVPVRINVYGRQAYRSTFKSLGKGPGKPIINQIQIDPGYLHVF